MRRIAFVTPVALLLALVIAGCGSKPLSSVELTKRATRVCQVAGWQTDQIPTPSTPVGVSCRGADEPIDLPALHPALGDAAARRTSERRAESCQTSTIP